MLVERPFKQSPPFGAGRICFGIRNPILSFSLLHREDLSMTDRLSHAAYFVFAVCALLTCSAASQAGQRSKPGNRSPKPFTAPHSGIDRRQYLLNVYRPRPHCLVRRQRDTTARKVT